MMQEQLTALPPEIWTNIIHKAAAIDVNFIFNLFHTPEFANLYDNNNENFKQKIQIIQNQFIKTPNIFNQLLEADFQDNMSWESFKTYLDSLLKNASTIIEFIEEQFKDFYIQQKIKKFNIKKMQIEEWEEFFDTFINNGNINFNMSFRLIKSMQRHIEKIKFYFKEAHHHDGSIKKYNRHIFNAKAFLICALLIGGSIVPLWLIFSKILGLSLTLAAMFTPALPFSLFFAIIGSIAAISTGLYFLFKKLKSDQKKDFSTSLGQLDNFQGMLEKAANNFSELERSLVIIECQSFPPDSVDLDKNVFILCKINTPPHIHYKLYYNNNNESLIETKLGTESLRLLDNKLSNLDFNNLSDTEIKEIKKMLNLDLSYHKKMCEQRDILVSLINEKFKNTNSRALLKIQAQLKQYPYMTPHRLFSLIQTEIGKSISVASAVKIESCCNIQISITEKINSFFKEAFRHPNIQALYDLINGGRYLTPQNQKLDLINSEKDRTTLINFIENNGPFVNHSQKNLLTETTPLISSVRRTGMFH
jgi:hypothetical protein